MEKGSWLDLLTLGDGLVLCLVEAVEGVVDRVMAEMEMKVWIFICSS